VRSADIRNEDLTGGDVANDSLQGIDVFNNSLTEDDIDEAAVPGLSDPRGYAEVFPGGGLTSNSKNVEQSDVVKPATDPNGDPLVGYYCFTLPFVVGHVQVTPRGNNRVGWDVTASIRDAGNDAPACPGTESATVETFDGSGNPADNVGFYVAFFN